MQARPGALERSGSLAGLGKPETDKLIERRESVRVLLSTPYRWEFRLRYGFFEAIVSDLGEGGMFVNIANPQLEGSRIDFEVQFADEMRLIEGRGEVAWVRDRGSLPEHGPGMGIRFLDLHGDSQEVVRGTVERRLPDVEPSSAQ